MFVRQPVVISAQELLCEFLLKYANRHSFHCLSH